MIVKMARTAGFCMGVRRAVNLALDASRGRSNPIHTLGPLIHNPQVVEMLESQGVVSVPDIPESGAVVIRSHGATPEVWEELKAKEVRIFNATCPRVSRVHGIVKSHHKKGYLIVVLGDSGHAEVEGIVGYADGEAAMVQGPEDVASLPDAKAVCLVAQTTQEREKFFAIAGAIREKYKHLPEDSLVIADTICDSTRNRQEEVRRLAREVEAMVVVGGKGSANTKRLAEVAISEGVPAFLVETESDLDPEALSGFTTVGLTAGASTPNWMIRRVYDELQQVGRPRGALSYPISILRWLVLANLYVALGGGAITLAASNLQGFIPYPREVLLSILYIFAVHTMSILADPKTIALSEPARARTFSQHRSRWILASIVSMIAAVAIGFSMGAITGLLFSAVAVVSLLYPVRLLRGEEGEVSIRSLAEIPASKDIFMALGWAVVIVVLPMVDHSSRSGKIPAFIAAFLMVFGLVFVRALLRDFRDIQADRLIGRETLPVILGTAATRRIVYATLFVLGIILVSFTVIGWVPSPLGYLLLVPLVYAGACVPLFTRQTIIQGFRAESIIDAALLLAGLIAGLVTLAA